MSAYTVREVIKLLQESYDLNEVIVIDWWDKNLSYLSINTPDWAWDKAMDMLGETDFDHINSMVSDVIAQKIKNAIAEELLK